MLWDFALRGRRLAAFGAALRAGFFATARFTVLRLAGFLAFFLADLTLPLRAFAFFRHVIPPGRCRPPAASIEAGRHPDQSTPAGSHPGLSAR